MKDVSLCTAIFSGARGMSVPMDRALDMTARAGFRYVEFSNDDTPPDRFHTLVESSGLEVWSVHGCLEAEAAGADRGQREKAIDAEIERMEKRACFAPCPYVIHYLSRINDRSLDPYWHDSVGRVLEKSSSLGFLLAVETVAYKPEKNERHPKTEEVVDFVRSFGSDKIGICMDVNHSNTDEILTDAVRTCEDLIATIHVSDNQGEREQHLLPGDGIIDFDETMTAAREAGYEGPLNLECLTEGEKTLELFVRLRKWAQARP